MNLQSMTIIFVIIFLPIILISTYYVQREVDTITLQTSYDTNLIDATTDAVSAFEINTANEDLSTVSDSLRSIIEASNNVFTTTLATNLGMSGATKSKVLPYIPAIVYTLYDGYYIYSPTKQAKVLTDPNGVYVRVGDAGVANIGKGIYQYNFDKVNDCDNDQAELEKLKKTPLYTNYEEDDFGKILYFSESSNGKSADTIDCTIYPEDFNKEKKDEKESAYFSTSYILKSFIPYSMRYKNENNDIVINYTLDNYITVYGTIGEIYYSKSGYLINYDNLKSVNGDPADVFCSKYSQNEIDDLVNTENPITLKFDTDGDSEIDISISSDTNSAKSKHYSGNQITDNESAVEYYLKAYIFSKWVAEELNLEMNDFENCIDEDYLKNLQNDFSIKQNGETLESNANLFWNYTEDSIFTTKGKWNVENTESNFYEHKRKVIKNSIQYNLNLAMATYNQGQGDEYYQMPILSEPEWDKLLSNVSVLAFMQGMPCGLKTYNNYALVTSTNNEIMANVDEIYYVPVEENIDIKALEDELREIEKSDEIETFRSKIKDKFKTNIGVITTQQKKLLKNAYKLTQVELSNLLTEEAKKQKQKELDNRLLEIYSQISLPNSHRISHIENYINDGIEIFQSFPSRELKYDKEYNSDSRNYEYDHVCNSCYDCIVNSNYDDWYEEYKILSNKSNKTQAESDRQKVIEDEHNINDIKKIELIAIGKIRNNTYKTCAIKTNNGIDVESNINQTFYDWVTNQKTDKIKNCYEIQITIDTSDINYKETKYMYIGKDILTYQTALKTPQTLIFKNSLNWAHNGVVDTGKTTFEAEAYKIKSNIDNDEEISKNIKVLSITYKYK